MRSLSDFKGQPIENLLLETQMGQVQGAYVIWKFGKNEAITTTETDVWEQGGVYVFPTSAAQLSVVGAAGDVTEITIDGLDADYNRLIEVVNLTGDTPLLTVGSFLRVNRAYNSNGLDLTGTVTITHGVDILATVSVADEQTLQAIATIPAGWTAYIFKGMASTGKGKDAQIIFKFRLEGKVFRIAETFGIYQNTYEGDRPFIPFPEKTDIKVSAISSSAGTNVSAQFGLLLLDNSIWKD